MKKSFIIAEAGVNHNGSEEMAMQLVEVAAKSGADAVKFQTFKAESLVRKGAKKAVYQQQQTGGGDQFSMLKMLELSDGVHVRLRELCEDIGIEFMSTGFDETSIDMLIDLGIKRLKVPSGELTNLPYIKYLAKKDVPIILSTGMGTLDEVRDAVECVRETRVEFGFVPSLDVILTLLHCTSNYPAPFESVNLKAMNAMADEFGLPVGYSDHTAGILVSPMAVALGATIIEKHFTLDRELPGPDHRASLEPDELAQMIKNIRDVERCLGDGVKAPTVSELEVRKLVRRSLVMRYPVKAGAVITEADLILLRPEGEISPRGMSKVIGKIAVRDLYKGQSLRWNDVLV